MKAGLAIVALAVSAACLYGIAHDLVTTHLCVEYFTIGHPPVFATERPVLLALGWGILATWWVGLALGIPLALCARCGRAPPLTARDLVRPVGWLLLAMAATSALAGLAGHALAVAGAIHLLPPLAGRVPADRHIAFLTDLWAHLGAYASGIIGGIVLCVVTARRRAARR